MPDNDDGPKYGNSPKNEPAPYQFNQQVTSQNTQKTGGGLANFDDAEMEDMMLD
jgi:hypothetical protein